MPSPEPSSAELELKAIATRLGICPWRPDETFDAFHARLLAQASKSAAERDLKKRIDDLVWEFDQPGAV